jgi:hypothetical protein
VRRARGYSAPFYAQSEKLVTNGSNFIFLKLVDHTYQMSGEVSLRRQGDLYQVLRILKQLADRLR